MAQFINISPKWFASAKIYELAFLLILYKVICFQNEVLPASGVAKLIRAELELLRLARANVFF
jgi:hypothetical protein